MNFRIETLPELLVVGRSVHMSFANNLTQELWQSFMPKRNEVNHRTNADFISIQLYPEEFATKAFNPLLTFTKWAGVTVDRVEGVPSEMDSLVIPPGLYAVFDYKGSSNNAHTAFQYIFSEWLPASKYRLDHRPHFEILGDKYKNNDPQSEEEIWIPIVLK